MSPPKRRVAVSFTGGKDSTLVLHLLRAPPNPADLPVSAALQSDLASRLVDHGVVGGGHAHGAAEHSANDGSQAGCLLEVCMLVTFVPAGGRSFKAHPLELIKAQSAALGLPHYVLEVGSPFLESYRDNMASLRKQHNIDLLATGDILDVCSNFMPRAAEGSGIELLRPLWGIDRHMLLELVWHYGMQAVITCINTSMFGVPAAQEATRSGDTAATEGVTCGRQQPPAATHQLQDGAAAAAVQEAQRPPLPLGRLLDRSLLSEVLQPSKALWGVDEGGEMGEYHTMVLDGRLFASPVCAKFQPEPQQEGDYRYLLLAAESDSMAATANAAAVEAAAV